MALAATQGKTLPALVLFVNDAPLINRADTPELKRKQVSIRNSKSLLFTVADPRIEDISMALKLFTIRKINVHGVSPASSSIVNEEQAPYAVIVDTEGKVTGVLGTAIPTGGQILTLLRKATKPRMDLDVHLAKKRNLVKEVVGLDAKEADLATKRKLATSEWRMKADIERLEKEIALMQASVQKQEAAIEAELQRTLRAERKPVEP
jgi:hypothetical protein